MFRKIREAQAREEGFTLIELLVVVIIIGILAAIAIPTFLNQRQKAWQSAVKSDLRNAATAQEAAYVDNDTYLDAVSGGAGATDDLSDYGFNKGSNITFSTVQGNATGFCMVASHNNNSTDTWYFDSSSGEPAAGAATDCTSGA